ncbi:hypothetical protein [Clostridium gasigenes]|uniref:Uncharacterized protein n=1 Tax=Clostridium gasigenes TaxID=94869 RepID=A0A1H0UEV2_9CLOT|nr:hypothetical protein [Clostridium gasigenes]MBU3089747.1 hypothetical protein [Clostridium gasigenes]SDP64600.1 hypothetical protein SAMN04488529_11080 [Clostridium gasigenes]
MKFIECKSEKIVKGIFLGGLVYLIGYILIFSGQSSTSSSLVGHYIAAALLLIGTLFRPIADSILYIISCFNCLAVKSVFNAIVSLSKISNKFLSISSVVFCKKVINGKNLII